MILNLKLHRLKNLYFLLLLVFLSFIEISSQENIDKPIDNRQISFQKSEVPLVITFNNSLAKSGPPQVNPFKVKQKKRSKKTRRNNPRLIKRNDETSGIGNFLIDSLFSPDSISQHLQNIKDKLLCYYAKKSGQLGSARDGIGFPSLEGALLSLAFLTFAVFLIDLVQTLLSRVRRPGLVNGTVNGRKRRSVEGQDAMSTLTSLVLGSIERPFFYFKNGFNISKD